MMRFYYSYRSLSGTAQRREKARRDFLAQFEDGWEQAGYVCWALYPKSRDLGAPEELVGFRYVGPIEAYGSTEMVYYTLARELPVTHSDSK